MARKMNPSQSIIVHRLINGWPVDLLPVTEQAFPEEYLTVLDNTFVMDGSEVRGHRTVKTDTPLGHQIQSFRVRLDGTIERKL